MHKAAVTLDLHADFAPTTGKSSVSGLSGALAQKLPTLSELFADAQALKAPNSHALEAVAADGQDVAVAPVTLHFVEYFKVMA